MFWQTAPSLVLGAASAYAKSHIKHLATHLCVEAAVESDVKVSRCQGVKESAFAFDLGFTSPCQDSLH